MTLLDDLAVNLGSLRISALALVKAMLSLAVLLWLATMASRLFERRITTFPALAVPTQHRFGRHDQQRPPPA